MHSALAEHARLFSLSGAFGCLLALVGILDDKANLAKFNRSFDKFDIKNRFWDIFDYNKI